jgi:hypothetical protein
MYYCKNRRMMTLRGHNIIVTLSLDKCRNMSLCRHFDILTLIDLWLKPASRKGRYIVLYEKCR